MSLKLINRPNHSQRSYISLISFIKADDVIQPNEYSGSGAEDSELPIILPIINPEMVSSPPPPTGQPLTETSAGLKGELEDDVFGDPGLMLAPLPLKGMHRIQYLPFSEVVCIRKQLFSGGS